MRIRNAMTVPMKELGLSLLMRPVKAIPPFAMAATPSPITIAFLRPIFEIVEEWTKLNTAIESSKVAVQAETA